MILAIEPTVECWLPPALDPAAAHWLNLLLPALRDLELPLPDGTYAVEHELAPTDFQPEFAVALSLGDMRLGLAFERQPWLDEFELSARPQWTALLPPDLVLAVVETAWQDVFDGLERWSGKPCRLAGVDVEDTLEAESNLIFNLIRLEDGARNRVRLTLPADAGPWLASRLTARNAAPRDWSGLPFRARVQIGLTELDRETFQNLHAGDLVLFDQCAGDGSGPLILKLSTELALCGRLEQQTFILEQIMNPIHPVESEPLQTENLPIELTFEVGRKTLTLGELEQLEPGSAIELDSALSRPVRVYAQGRPMATGELVRLEDRLGVRLVEVSSHASR